MSEKKKLRRFSLAAALKHSQMLKPIEIAGARFLLRPWSSVELEELQPLLSRIFKEFKKYQDSKEDVMDVVISILSQKEYMEDARHIVYVTIKNGNNTVLCLHPDGQKDSEPEEMELFTYEEFKSMLPFSEILKIVQVVWEQNFTKNQFISSKLNPPKSEETEVDPEATPREAEEAKHQSV